MKRIRWFLLLGLTIVFATACVTVPVRGGLKTAVNMEDIVFYEKMDFFDKNGEKKELGKFSKEEYEKDIQVVFSKVREDEFSKEVSETFRNKFVEELEENGFERVSDAAIRIKTEMAFGTRSIDASGQLAESRYLQVRMSVYRDAEFLFERKSLLGAFVFLKAIVIGGPEVLANRLAKSIADQFSKELVAYFIGQSPPISKK